MNIARLLQRLGRTRSANGGLLFVIAAPRAGTTRLAQFLTQAEHVRPLAAEVRQHAEALLATHLPASDRQTALDATPERMSQLHQVLGDTSRGWMVEHTGINALRVPFLAAAFPTARFVFLARDPAEQVARIIAAWHSGQYVTHQALPDWDGPWSLPLIPAWAALRGRSIAEIALAQWATITAMALDDLAELPDDRWCLLSYESLRSDPHGVMHMLGQFGGLRWRRTPTLAQLLATRQHANPADLAVAHSLLPLADPVVRQLMHALHQRDLQRPLTSHALVRRLPSGMRRTLASGSVAAALLGSNLVPAQVAQAATFQVTNLNDSGAGSLRQAIADANGAAGPDVITFQSGLTGTITLTTGQLLITDSVDVQGPGAAVISVSGNNTSRVFYLYNSTANIAISMSGLTITGGNANDGGGIKNKDEDLTLNRVTLSGNTSTDDGGGLWADGFYMDLTIIDSIISGNTSSSEGGGIYIDDTGGPLLIQDTDISGNIAGGNGGGIYFYDPDQDVTIERSTISGNTAAGNGGGLELYDTDGGGVFTIRDSIISNNTAPGDGGGIFLYEPDYTVVIERSTISGNTADNGGGINIGDLSSGVGNAFIIRESTISNNSAASGGGIYFYDVGVPTLIENSTISGNQSSGDGGGLYFEATTGEVKISHTTIVNNSASGAGGGIEEDSSDIVVEHSIIADNIAGSNADFNFTQSIVTFSLIEDTGAGINRAFTDGNNNIINEDPQLGPLQNNGGPTETHLPALTSPAVNSGNPAIVGAPSTDQRGFTRIRGSKIDMGAVETDYGTALSLTVNSITVNEGLPTATLSVTRTGGIDGAVAVDFVTSNGTATAGQDFTATNGTLNWTSGDRTAKTITIPITNDTTVEPNETFSVTLSNVQNATLGTITVATITITDNDTAPPPPPPESTGYSLFLPNVIHNPLPDLVVSSIALAPNKTSFAAGEPVEIAVTITNQGTAPSGPFWIDMYLNPSEEPTVNKAWHVICGITPCYGVVWGVVQTLQPGQSVTIRSTVGSYAPEYTSWQGAFASGTNRIVVLADSINRGVATGAVLESNEANNSGSLNISVTGVNPPSLNKAPESVDTTERPLLPER